MTAANAAMLEQIKSGQGFIAALDQSGGSTPKALKGYGIDEDAFSNDEEMFGLIHAMRYAIVPSPRFNGVNVIGAKTEEACCGKECVLIGRHGWVPEK